MGFGQLIDQDIAVFHLWQVDHAVAALFPNRRHIDIIVEDDEFQLKALFAELTGVEIDNPLIVVVLHHGHGILHGPTAQHGVIAQYGKPLIAAQLRSAHLEAHGLHIGMLQGVESFVAVDAVGECRTVEVGILRDIDPMVIDGVFGGFSSQDFQAMGFLGPFPAKNLFTTVEGIEIIEVCTRFHHHAESIRPAHAVTGAHAAGGDFLFSILVGGNQIEHKFLAEGGLVVNIEK